MSVRTYDPRSAEIFEPGRCSERGCGLAYYTICGLCNLAYCFGHLKGIHVCNTRTEFLVLTEEEVEEIHRPIPHAHVYDKQLTIGSHPNRGYVLACECGAMEPA